MKHRSYIIYLFLLCLWISGCKSDDAVDPGLIDLELTDQFLASVYEDFDDSGRRFIWLQLETLEEFSCNNYQLELEYRTVDDDIHIDIKGIFLQDNVACEEGINNATARIELGQLDIKTYTIHLTLLDELQEKGLLVNTTEYVDLDFPEDGWVQIPHSRMIKVPGNTVWGYYLGENGHFDELAAEYIEGLEAFGNPLENDGYFGAFTVQQGQVKIIDNELNNTILYNGFGMKYFGDREVLKEWILNNYCHLPGTIGLLSTNGDLTPCE